MQTEVEAKFLNINHESLRSELKAANAIMQQPMRTMKRVNMDYEDKRLQAKSGWLRVRDEGHRVTLTYKQLADWTVDGVQEAEVVVSDFDTTVKIFESLGLRAKSYQESKRETWSLDEVEVVLDEWPWVQPFCEIEGPSEDAIKAVATKLGLQWNDAVFGSVEPVYRAEYDITDEEFYTLSRMIFDEPLPALLADRKRYQESSSTQNQKQKLVVSV